MCACVIAGEITHAPFRWTNTRAGLSRKWLERPAGVSSTNRKNTTFTFTWTKKSTGMRSQSRIVEFSIRSLFLGAKSMCKRASVGMEERVRRCQCVCACVYVECWSTVCLNRGIVGCRTSLARMNHSGRDAFFAEVWIRWGGGGAHTQERRQDNTHATSLTHAFLEYTHLFCV